MKPAVRPLSSVAFAFGLVRGFAASLLRVAAGEKGPIVPGFLPGPVACPVEEDVAPEDTTRLLTVEEPAERHGDQSPTEGSAQD
jgi:hypothetical protein